MKAFNLFSENYIELKGYYPILSEFEYLKFLSAAKTSLKDQLQKQTGVMLNEI